MNDVIDLIEAVWPDPPGPSAASFAQARARLTEAMATEVSPTAGGRGHIDRPSARLLAIARRRRWWATVAAVAAVTVVISLVIPGSPSRPTSAAAAELQKMARLAAAARGDVPGPGQYLYVKTHQMFVSGMSIAEPVMDYVSQGTTFETWVNSEGLGREVVIPDSTVHWITPGGAAVWAPRRQQLRAECEAQTAGKCTDQFLTPAPIAPFDGAWSSTSNLTYPANQSLPTNPAALERAILAWNKSHLYEGAGEPIGEQLFRAVENDLQAGASPKLVSAIYQMISKLSGIKLLGQMTDSQGRSGIGVGYTDTNGDGEQQQLIFNPTTGALLEARSVQIGPSAQPIGPLGTVHSETTFEAASVVGSLPAAATARHLPGTGMP